MSLWRKEASKRLPELQRIIASRDVDNPMMLWIELKSKFDELCAMQPPPIDLIRRVWEYAKWCMAQGSDDVGTAAALAFCEHLLDWEPTRRLLPQFMNRADYTGLKELLLYHNAASDFEMGLRLFDS